MKNKNKIFGWKNLWQDQEPRDMILFQEAPQKSCQTIQTRKGSGIYYVTEEKIW